MKSKSTTVSLNRKNGEVMTSELETYKDWYAKFCGHECILGMDYTSLRVGFDTYEMYMYFDNPEDAVAFKLKFGL